MKPKIEVASLAGFCFGVKRAYETVKTLSEKGEYSIYTLGKLIHNDGVVAELERDGVGVISEAEIDGIFQSTDENNPCAVVIRAHGIPKRLSERLQELSNRNRYFKTVDCTCPLVKKIHNLVNEHSQENNLTLIFGDEKHPEVEGIRSYAKGENIVFGDICELKLTEIADKPLILVSQTTQNLTEWKKSQNFIKKVCTNSLIFDTICSVTEKRQEEVASLAKRVDLMLIVGGRNSSNTNKLYTIAKSILTDTLFIESAADIPAVLPIIKPTKVGIAAGASTPGNIIEEVKTIMSDKLNKTNEVEDFEQLLESSFKTLNTGDMVTGTILSVDANEVKVDIGAKVTGILPASDLVDPSLKLTDVYKPGDEITAKAVRVSDVDGVATLSRRQIEANANWKKVADAKEADAVLEGKITESNKGGVVMNIHGVRVFIPASQTGLPRGVDFSSLVGQTKKIKITDVDEARHRIAGSIRVIEREERKAVENKFWDEMEVGKKFTGKVKSLTSFGAFVDLGPVDGMVHTTELSWQRIKQPSDVVSVGEVLEVFVKDFDREKKRISLGYKTEATNPWVIFTNKYQVGSVASVKVVSLMPFGAFAEIVPGVDGLIHISQITNEKKIANPGEVLALGQVLDAKIVDIDEENKRISLSVKALTEPEEEEEVAEVEAETEEAPAESE